MKTVYSYVDEAGLELYRKVRLDEEDGSKRVWTEPEGYAGPRALYCLPEVIASPGVIVVEGEKCADIGNRLGVKGWVFTTSGSSNSWRPEFAETLKGKTVLVIPDNDEPGERYLRSIAETLDVSVLRLPNLPEKGDIADWVAAGGTAEQLEDLLSFDAEPYVLVERSTDQSTSLASAFAEASELTEIDPAQINWLLESVIERKANGLLYADPKMAKSWITLSMALHIASGKTWFGHRVPNPARVGIASREDGDDMTIRRLKQLERGYGIKGSNVFLATRSKLYGARLDEAGWVKRMGNAIQDLGLEIMFWDVFNRFHSGDENDNTGVRKVLDALDNLTATTGCQHCLIHHTSKDAKSKRPRGASCIDGWAEFRMRVTWQDEVTQTRRIDIDGKSTSDIKPIIFRIATHLDSGRVLREVVGYNPPPTDNKRPVTQT